MEQFFRWWWPSMTTTCSSKSDARHGIAGQRSGPRSAARPSWPSTPSPTRPRKPRRLFCPACPSGTRTTAPERFTSSISHFRPKFTKTSASPSSLPSVPKRTSVSTPRNNAITVTSLLSTLRHLPDDRATLVVRNQKFWKLLLIICNWRPSSHLQLLRFNITITRLLYFSSPVLLFWSKNLIVWQRP